MSRAITFAAYAAIGIGTIGTIRPAFDQSRLEQATTAALFSPDAIRQQTITPQVLKDLARVPKAPVVVISHGPGGLINEHNQKYAAYAREKTKVRVVGGCYSACTLVTAYVNPEDLCIAPGAFFAFHAVRSAERGELMPAATAKAYWQQPMAIRRWIDRNGGYENLPLNGFWTMYDRDLWEIGYPRCTP